MTTVASGVIMLIGNYDTIAHPDRTQREVHPTRRHESITYRIESDDFGLQLTEPDGTKWAHYRYRFFYRYMGNEFSIRWRCGSLYGSPKPIDGLRSAFQDAELTEWDAFGQSWAEELGYDWDFDRDKARRIYKACEQINERLDRVFGEMRTRWRQAVEEK